jgi:hypothetical protein
MGINDIPSSSGIIIKSDEHLEQWRKKTIIFTTDMYHDALKDKVSIDAMWLYLHYHYTGRLQKTNQPMALDSYCKKGLRWGQKRFSDAKRKLTELKWIEPKLSRDERGRITGHYIRLKYIVKDSTLQKVFPQIEEDTSSSTETHIMGSSTNGYQNTNALSNQREMLKVDNDPNGVVVNNILKECKELNIAFDKKFIHLMINKYDIDTVKYSFQELKLTNENDIRKNDKAWFIGTCKNYVLENN